MEQSTKRAFMHNWHKAIKIIGVAVFFFSFSTISAQIKIVGDNYADSLTGSKSYYNKDVDFDKLFPSINNTEYSMLSPYWSIFEHNGHPHESPYWELNLSGDTVYLPEDVWIESVPSSTINNMYTMYNSKAYDYPAVNDFCIDNTGEYQNRLMAKGYYEITGYVFCSDNGDSVRTTYKLAQPQHLYWTGEWKPLAKRNGITTKELKDNILKGEVGKISDYIMYVIFRPLESTDTIEYFISYDDRFISSSGNSYYYNRNRSLIHKIMPLRFYNVANSYIGEEVVLFEQQLSNTNMINTIIKDSISDRLIKIQDGVFVVKDVVMKDNHYYAILVGPETGSFAFPLNIIIGTNTIKHSIPDYTDLSWWAWTEKVKKGEIGGDALYFVSDEGYNKKYRRLGLIKKQDLEMLRKRQMTAQSQLEKERKLQEQRSKIDKEKKEAAFRQQMLTKYGERFGNLVANKQVAIDMTQAMVSDAWGKPMNIYRTTTKYGQSEVWCYNYKTKVYLYNGKVVQIDD